jgi:glycosyltransferase involved in cell wall biosynthesis
MIIGIDCRLPTYQMGGISQYSLQLVQALAAVDEENNYVLYHSRKETRSFVPNGSGRWKRRDLWTPCHHRFERITLTAEILGDGLDVLHSPDFIPPAGGASRRVITIHDLNFIFFPELLTDESRRYYADQIAWAASTADAIAADSLATRRDIIEELGVAPEKVTAVHLAANPVYRADYSEEAVQATLRKYGLEPGYVLSVGTLEPRKNLPMLLRVYARLRSEEGVEAPLVLAGRLGWKYGEIMATIETLDLAPFVSHIADAGDLELAHLYHGAGVLATPSFYEGFGLPALEAQHCGCAVVVSDRGSLPEIAGEDGLILPLENETVWVETLARVLHDSDFRALQIKRGYQQAERFSWERTAAATLALYEGG